MVSQSRRAKVRHAEDLSAANAVGGDGAGGVKGHWRGKGHAEDRRCHATNEVGQCYGSANAPTSPTIGGGLGEGIERAPS